jgi:hypothetical protein
MSLHTIPRHKMLLWRILNNALPLRVSLEKRGVHCSPLCPRCNAKLETQNHVFMECPLITRTWFGSPLNLRILNQPINNYSDWLAYNILHESERVVIQIATITYYIWFSRNLSIFEDRMLPEDEIIKRAYNIIFDFQQANLTSSQSSSLEQSTAAVVRSHQTTLSTRWKKPEAPLVKANSDANLQRQGWWGVGAIVRNAEGLVMAAATWTQPGAEKAELAEAYGLLLTMRMVQDCGFREVVFEGDNEKIWKMVGSGAKDDRSYLGSVIQEIQKIKPCFDTCLFRFTHRDSNLVGHKLAQLAHTDPNKVWIEEVPPLLGKCIFMT